MTTVSAASNDLVKWAANSPEVLSKQHRQAGKHWLYLTVFPKAKSRRAPNVIQHTSQHGSHEGLMLRHHTSVPANICPGKSSNDYVYSYFPFAGYLLQAIM